MADVILNNKVILELKIIKALGDIHCKQVLTNFKVGYTNQL
ncbi:GxxExxY protein [Niabella aquatica]